MKWGINLTDNDKSIEQKILLIVSFLTTKYIESRFSILNIDATGVIGNYLTQTINNSAQAYKIEHKRLEQLLLEDGQILELLMNCEIREFYYQIDVKDGRYIDVYSNYELLPEFIVGKYEYI